MKIIDLKDRAPQESQGSITDPLVSVNVVAYNSSDYILETLESIKAQTYQNLELIISDDCSKDNTVALCRDWLSENGKRFVKSEIITTPTNTGIPKNCNRALKASSGVWIKGIAADDALMENCIRDNIDFVLANPQAAYCFSDQETYKDTFEAQNLQAPDVEYLNDATKFSELNSEYQFKVMARFVIIRAPTNFIKREKLLALGGYDESFPFIEDWPTYYHWLKSGEKFYFLSKKTVKYRIHGNSISNAKDSKKMVISSFPIKVEPLIRKFYYPYYTLKEKILFNMEYGFYRYYQEREVRTLFGVALRRAWYFFVEQSLDKRRNALKHFYSKFMKTRKS